MPFDVSEATLREAAERVLREHPGIEVHAIVGDFERQLELLPAGDRRLIAFLGSTIGNLDQTRRAALLSDVADGMGPGDRFLLGADLVKDTARLQRAYDDSQGLSAAFDLHLLTRLNSELGADFDVDQFAHEARWVPEHEWMQMGLRSLKAQKVRIRSLELTVPFDERRDAADRDQRQVPAGAAGERARPCRAAPPPLVDRPARRLLGLAVAQDLSSTDVPVAAERRREPRRCRRRRG